MAVLDFGLFPYADWIYNIFHTRNKTKAWTTHVSVKSYSKKKIIKMSHYYFFFYQNKITIESN